MGQIIIDTAKKNTAELSELNENVITITDVTAETIDQLTSLIRVKTEFEGGRTTSYAISLLAYINVYKKEPIAEINKKITDCRSTILTVEPANNKPVKLYINYQTVQDKLKKIEGEKERQRSDITKEIANWKQAVKDLSDSIRKTVFDTLKDTSITLNNEPIQLTEMNIQYSIDAFNLVLPNGNIIFFKPVGTYLAGGLLGRVDVLIRGINTSIMLLLTKNDKGERKWNIVYDRNINQAKEFKSSDIINLIDEAIEY